MRKLKSIQKIVQLTGRKPSECSCFKCQAQCKTPCLGTPEDILRIIEAGYISKLKTTVWLTGFLYFNKPSILMVQAIKTQEGFCIFFKNGKCELHNLGLKPVEGILSNHSIKLDNFVFDLSLSWNVAKEWINPENIITKLKIFAHITLYESMKAKDEFTIIKLHK